MLLITGLGNPGAQYARNRHNIGFMAVDEIHARHRFSPWSKKFQGLISEGMIDGEKVLLLKPQTFMNLSGQSVGEAMRFYKLAISDLIVVYDELDLPPAKLRVKAGGSARRFFAGTGISTRCPSTTPVGLALGPDLPRAD